jgi:hypothetical protein
MVIPIFTGVTVRAQLFPTELFSRAGRSARLETATRDIAPKLPLAERAFEWLS